MNDRIQEGCARAVDQIAEKLRGNQRFVFSHLDKDSFKRDGLRPFFEYRDLGLFEATGGLAQAHVNRAAAPTTPGKWHCHEVGFQFVYLLSGWLRCEFEGEGEVVMHAGTAWIQPPGLKHIVHEYSDDFQSLELILPGDFVTREVPPPPADHASRKTPA